MTKKFLKKLKWKRLWKISWAAEFKLRGLNKLQDKWQEMIQNNGEYTIDWNLFFIIK